MSQDKLERATYTVEEAAVVLGIGRSAAYLAAQSGELPTVRIGRRVLVPKPALNQMLNGEVAPRERPGRGREEQRKRPDPKGRGASSRRESKPALATTEEAIP